MTTKSLTTHAIFDLTGTVIDVSRLFFQIISKISHKYGKPLAPELEGYYSSFSKEALGFNELIESTLHSLGLTCYDELKTELSRVCPFGDLMPGVERLVRHLYNNNIPMAIATNITQGFFSKVPPESTDFINKYFTHVVTGYDDPEVKHNKPAKDIYLVCAKRFQTPPESLDSCVIFEDSLLGITGAVASGMKTVLINNRKFCSFDEISDKITLIVDSFENFDPKSVGLPQY